MLTNDLANWYISNNVGVNDKADFISAFNGTPTNDKSLVLLIGKGKLYRGCHQGYLWRFPKNWCSRGEILKRIKCNALWSLPLKTIRSFEDLLYRIVESKVNNPKIPQIGQLIIYDIALHLAYIEGTGRLMPKDYVYIHALPMKAWNNLVSNGFLVGFKRNSKSIPYSSLTSYFPRLNSFQIEDLLCHIGKSLRRIKKGVVPNKKSEKDIDAIIKQYGITKNKIIQL